MNSTTAAGPEPRVGRGWQSMSESFKVVNHDSATASSQHCWARNRDWMMRCSAKRAAKSRPGGYPCGAGLHAPGASHKSGQPAFYP